MEADLFLFARCMLPQGCDVKVPSCGSKGGVPWHVSSAGLSPARSWPSCCLGVNGCSALLRGMISSSPLHGRGSCADGAAGPDGGHGGGPWMAVAWIV